ncbi:hypothetical protein BDV24DRAFT_94641 [Aspergillus arachidicola]|uniref:Uncharacterized protein n=1 Tax=Aspergillus arachidicola TaxID=656916 RepID=A0A5N6XZY6_9EURO|nr:hypothetical protein BDV24DRAFT_94641 [Aspergillus arachidicola]
MALGRVLCSKAYALSRKAWPDMLTLIIPCRKCTSFSLLLFLLCRPLIGRRTEPSVSINEEIPIQPEDPSERPEVLNNADIQQQQGLDLDIAGILPQIPDSGWDDSLMWDLFHNQPSLGWFASNNLGG